MKGNVMDSTSPFERKYPKVLEEKLSFALSAFHKVGNTHKERRELLDRFRRNRMRIIARGITHGRPVDNSPVVGYENIPHEHYNAIVQMDEAYNEIRQFLEGGAMDYCAASVTALVEPYLTSRKNSDTASLPRKKESKDSARALWDEWQKDPSLYPNKQQFTDGIKRKCRVSQNTARTWFDQFRPSASPEWEAAYGKKYPK